MPVNNAESGISLSELRSYYGGSAPDSMSEYYRGGSFVPTTRTILNAGSGSGSGNGSAASVSVTVQNSSTNLSLGSFGGGNPATLSVSAFSGYNFSVYAGGGSIVYGGYPGGVSVSNGGNPGGGSFGSNGYTFYRSTRTYGSYTNTITGSSGSSWTLAILVENGWGPYPSVSSNSSSQARRTFNFQNNTGQTISLSTTSQGGNSNTQSVTSGATVTRGPFNGTNQSWTFSYPSITADDANNNLPSSGTVNLNAFRSVTNVTSS